MTQIALIAGALALAVSAALDGPSLTSALLAPESRVTTLAGEGCTDEPGGLRCRGLGGATLVTGVGPDGPTLALSWSVRSRSDPLVDGVEPASSVEWRGRPTSKGFEPHAAIVRLADRSGLPAAAAIRVGPREACLIGIAVGGDAEEAARRLTDERARTFRCGRDAPVLDEAAVHRRSTLAGAEPRFPALGRTG